MKLTSYYAHGLKIGVVADNDIWDLQKAYELYLLEEQLEPHAGSLARSLVPADMQQFIQINHTNLDVMRHAIARLAEDAGRRGWCETQGFVAKLNEVRLLPPILRPSKIIAIGNAFREHIVRVNKMRGVPEDQIQFPPSVKVSFLKAPSGLIATGDTVRYPKDSDKWDYEGEFAIVIGRACSHVPVEKIDDYIFGYTALNDVSNRSVPPVLGGNTSPKAKAADTFAPMGPVIVPHGDLGKDPNDVMIKVWVNGELRQDGNTSDLLWPMQEIVSFTSSFMHLNPGDVITTSAPAGVGLETGKYLSEGDVVRIEIEGIGVLENPVGSPY